MTININEILKGLPVRKPLNDDDHIVFEPIPLSFETPDLDDFWEKQRTVMEECALNVRDQKEATIKAWFGLVGYKFDSDQDYYTFLKNNCQLVTNGKSYQVLDIVTKKEIISWIEVEEPISFFPNGASFRSMMIPTFKIK